MQSEKIAIEIEDAKTLKVFLDKANDWVDRAAKLTFRKSKKRKIADDVSAERKPTLEEVEVLLTEYDALSFEAPEYTTLQFFIKGAARYLLSSLSLFSCRRDTEIYCRHHSFRDKARQILENFSSTTLADLNTVLTCGKTLDVHLNEITELEKRISHLEFLEKGSYLSLVHNASHRFIFFSFLFLS